MAIATYPFVHVFDKDGLNGSSGISYTIEIDRGKTILKLGYNLEEELYEQLTFKGIYIIEDEKRMVTLVYRGFTTSTGKVQKSERMPDILMVNVPAQFDEEGNETVPAIPYYDMFDERYGKELRAHFANGLAESAGLAFPIFDPMTHQLLV